MLDIGCGTATKILPFARKAHEVISVEPSAPMRDKAEENIREHGLENVRIIAGSADHLPFEDESFDMVTSMLAPDDPDEIFRVLRPGGIAIIEKLGEQDKTNLKGFFGSDDQGPRGQLGDLLPGERLRKYKEEYGRRFKKVLTQDGMWDTFYTRKGLIILLENTSVIRGFDLERDREALDKAVEALETPSGILIPQHRILVIAEE